MLPLLIGLIVLTLKGKEWDLHIRIFSSTIALSVSLGTFFIWDILMYKNVIGINGGTFGVRVRRRGVGRQRLRGKAPFRQTSWPVSCAPAIPLWARVSPPPPRLP